MLNHTKKIRLIYEDIQRKIYYMIPEKWENLYLYSSVIDDEKGKEKGELFFYYIPKGIFRKNPVNVYEIPSKFNLDETQYLRLVDSLYKKIKELRNQFIEDGVDEIWSNITISIENLKFKVEYDYENLQNSVFNSYERHVIWRYKNLGIGMAQANKKDREILRRYENGAKTLERKEKYEAGIYISDIENIVDYSSDNYESTQNVEYVATKNNKISKNQILMAVENDDNLEKEETKNSSK